MGVYFFVFSSDCSQGMSAHADQSKAIDCNSVPLDGISLMDLYNGHYHYRVHCYLPIFSIEF